MIKLNLKNFNRFTILSILFLLAGVIHYLYWGARYGIWVDTGIYSITIVLIIPGIVGIILTLMEKEETQD
jgi:hypothetical protein